MTKEWFVAMCLISWTGWRFHPGVDKETYIPTSVEMLQKAEELWQLMQR